MITRDFLEEVLFQLIKKASCHIPVDIENAFIRAMDGEESHLSKKAFKNTYQSLLMSKERENLACPDTGWPLFFYKIGNDASVEGGLMSIEEMSRKAVEKATREGYLRSTMKHPFTGWDPGNNIGANVPGFSYKFVPGDSIQASFVAKGGGSECFGGTQYRVIAFADGLTGIKKFIIDAYISACRAGAICPPAVLGVGIGGTSDICTKLAKEAATLRLVGSRNPDREIAELERDLFESINQLGIGAMGSGGKISVFGVHLEYAYTHLAGIGVAINTNCFIARRATVTIGRDLEAAYLDDPRWFS